MIISIYRDSFVPRKLNQSADLFSQLLFTIKTVNIQQRLFINQILAWQDKHIPTILTNNLALQLLMMMHYDKNIENWLVTKSLKQ